MTLSQAMLDCARAAVPSLGHSVERIAAYVTGCLREAGGFADRAGHADLYYTVFGLDCLLALGRKIPFPILVRKYLRGALLSAAPLDLVHLAGLARCWSRLPHQWRDSLPDAVAGRIAGYRSEDGGYHTVPGSVTGSVYGAFLAVSGLMDAGRQVDSPERVLDSAEALAADGGGYANSAGAPLSTQAAAGAVLVRLALGAAPRPAALRWLAQRHVAEGGFVAGLEATEPDLVSTATALFALHMAGFDLDPFRASDRDFVAGLWDETGGFCGHWLDEQPDCEHTFDALLALGCLEAERMEHE